MTRRQHKAIDVIDRYLDVSSWCRSTWCILGFFCTPTDRLPELCISWIMLKGMFIHRERIQWILCTLSFSVLNITQCLPCDSKNGLRLQCIHSEKTRIDIENNHAIYSSDYRRDFCLAHPRHSPPVKTHVKEYRVDRIPKSVVVGSDTTLFYAHSFEWDTLHCGYDTKSWSHRRKWCAHYITVPSSRNSTHQPSITPIQASHPCNSLHTTRCLLSTRSAPTTPALT